MQALSAMPDKFLLEYLWSLALTCHEEVGGDHARGQIVDAHIIDVQHLQLRLQVVQ